ncbi:MAG: sodium:solute symporter [Cytophagaceae bacterium]
MNFELVDLIIVAGYFIAVFCIGFYFSGKDRNSTDYFLAGRHVAWYAIGASLFASNISSEHFIGLASSGYKSGLAVGNFEWSACLVVLILAWFFVPFYLKSGVFTMPEFIEKRFNSSSRWYLTTVSIIAYVLTKVSVTLYAGGILLQHIFGWDLYTSAMVMVLATGLYTVAGGLASVIYTEFIQTIVLITGALLLTVIGLNELGGFQALQSKVPADFFSMFKPMSDPEYPWTGIVFGTPIIGIWYWCTDQFMVQRVLSAKNIDHARAGSISSGYLKILPVFILVMPGIIAKALYPDIEPNAAYPTIVSNLLPAGIKGIVVAGLLAALMSSLASCFNSSSTLFTLDIYKKLRPQAPESSLINVGRFATCVLIVLGILWVPFIDQISSQIFLYLQSMQAYIAPPITAVFIIGIIWARANGTGAIYVLLVGFVIGATRFILEITNHHYGLANYYLRYFAEINFLHFAVFLFILSAAILIILSLLTEKPPMEKVRGLTLKYANSMTLEASYMSEGVKWKKINIIASVFLVVILSFLWFVFF